VVAFERQLERRQGRSQSLCVAYPTIVHGVSEERRGIFWNRTLACGRDLLTKFSRHSGRHATGARSAAFSYLAEGFRPGAARSKGAGGANIFRGTMAGSRQSGPRLYHGCLFVLPALLRAPSDGFHLRYLRAGDALDALAPDRAQHVCAPGTNFRGIPRRRASEAPLPAGVARGHPARGEEEAANAGRAAGEGSRHDQRLNRFWNQTRCTLRKTIPEGSGAGGASAGYRFSHASGRRAAHSDREPGRRWDFRGRPHDRREGPRCADR
jgi:hypothetical protein